MSTYNIPEMFWHPLCMIKNRMKLRKKKVEETYYTFFDVSISFCAMCVLFSISGKPDSLFNMKHTLS